MCENGGRRETVFNLFSFRFFFLTSSFLERGDDNHTIHSTPNREFQYFVENYI